MLKNKIFIFITILLFSLLFLCGSVYATEDTGSLETTKTFNFTGFDGVYYTLPALPEGIANYKHYVLVKNMTENNFVIFCFNDSLQINRDDYWLVLNGDNSTTGKIFTSTNTSWKEFGDQKHYSFLPSSFIVYSCQDLLPYKENFDDENFLYPPQVQGTLAPIYQETRLVGVLQEILAILPVVLMIIVGLIGLRKVLKFLSTVLHRS